jgi:thymidylate kinase
LLVVRDREFQIEAWQIEAHKLRGRIPISWRRFAMSAPRPIVFEGVDAVGKSAVCARYLSCLRDRGVSARLLLFPGKVPRTLGYLVYTLDHHPRSLGVDRLTPTSLQVLHVAAHLDAIETVILPSLEAGETIVLDRYWWSTWVYGIVGGSRPGILEALIETERLAWGRRQPGLLFHLTRTAPLRDEPVETWARLQHEYEALVKRESNKYPIRVLSNDDELELTVSRAIAGSYGQ